MEEQDTGLARSRCADAHNMENEEIQAQVLSPGVARGELRFLAIRYGPLGRDRRGSVTHERDEIEKFQWAIAEVVSELSLAGIFLEKRQYLAEAAILKAHSMLLRDEEFLRQVRDNIAVRHLGAEAAMENVLERMAGALEASKSPLLAERVSDLKDLQLRVRMKLSESSMGMLDPDRCDWNRAVVAMEELLPSTVLAGVKSGVRAFIVDRGTQLSHAAIMAKSFGIPVIRIAALTRINHKEGTEVLVNALKGSLVLNPLDQEAEPPARPLPSPRARADLPATIWLNVSDAEHFDRGWLEGASGIGLYRTESLFLKKEQDFPTEQEQMQVYSDFFHKCRAVPVTVRTLDIGGDKQLRHFSLGPQGNPYLGLRAHRIYRFHPELFITQLRAVLRAAAKMPALRLIYPMVEGVDELVFIKELAAEAIQSLRREGCEFQESFQTGILLEVPAAVWNLPDLLPCVDFISIGTNDLLQYFFAADRNNANVRASCQPENPGVLRMLGLIADTAKAYQKPLMLCGEIAADPDLLPLLIGLGFAHLSVDVHAVPRVAESLSRLAVEACRLLTRDCMRASRTTEVRKILAGNSPRPQPSGVSPLPDYSEALDPVCGMEVETAGNRFAFTWADRRFHFCSRNCLARFLAGLGQPEAVEAASGLRPESDFRTPAAWPA